MSTKGKIIDGKKLCSCCEEILPVSAFGKRKDAKSGLKSACRKCRVLRGRFDYIPEYNHKEVIDGKQECSICKLDLPVGSFHKSKSNHTGLEYRCKECNSKRTREWRSKPGSKEIAASTAKAYRKRNPEYRKRQNGIRRKNSMIRNYGITIGEYDTMFEIQNGVCKTCGLPEINSRLSIDHCHETDKVRGLLCRRCNMVLGNVEENQETLWNMIEYLKEHKLEGAK